MAKLEEEIISIEAVIRELTAEISQCDQNSRTLDARQQELRQQIYQAQNAQAETNAQLQQTAGQLHRTTAEAPLIAGEMESIDRQVAQSQERHRECEARVAELESQSKQAEATIHELGSQVIVRQHQVSEISEKVTQARVAMGQVQEQRSSLSRALATARQAVAQAGWNCSGWPVKWKPLTVASPMPRQPLRTRNPFFAKFRNVRQPDNRRIGVCSESVGKLRTESSGVARALDTLQQESEALGRSEHELSLAAQRIKRAARNPRRTYRRRAGHEPGRGV